MSVSPLLDLAALLADPRRIEQVPPDRLPDLIGAAHALCARLELRLRTAGPASVPTCNGRASADGERLLTAQAVAERLGTSVRWVYDHQQQLGGRRLSRRCLRFPESAVSRYLERRR